MARLVLLKSLIPEAGLQIQLEIEEDLESLTHDQAVQLAANLSDEIAERSQGVKCSYWAYTSEHFGKMIGNTRLAQPKLSVTTMQWLSAMPARELEILIVRLCEEKIKCHLPNYLEVA